MRKPIGSMVVLVVAMVLTPLTHAADELPVVKTWQELRDLKPITVDDFDVRVGVSDGGPDAGPWMLLHCYAVPRRAGSALPTSTTDEPLGPLTYRLRPKNKLQSAAQKLQRAAPVHAEGSIYTSLLPMHQTVPMTLEIRAGAADAVLLSRDFEPLVRSVWEWHRFAALRRIERGDDTAFVSEPTIRSWAVVPVMNELVVHPGRAAVTPATRPAVDVRLPGQLPPEPTWVDKRTDRPTLELSVEGGQFIVRADGWKMLDWADHTLVARWWVNGRPVPAEPLQRERMVQQLRQVSATDLMRIRFGYPEALGTLQPGDRVGLQLLYSPHGSSDLRRDSGVQQRSMQSSAVGPLIMSNRLDIVMTRELIDLRDAAAKEQGSDK